jgi:hypothetical protein
MMAGCGGSAPRAGLPATFGAQQSRIAPAAHRARSLLFESDGNYQTVEMFSLPDLKFQGAVAGFDYPEGLCSDTNGNVWVANYRNVVELSHEGRVLQTLPSYRGFSASCAVDPKNGDLAVANITGTSYAGMVLIYPHASATATPRIIQCANLAQYFFVAYDPKGTLYVDGRNYSDRFQLCRGKDTQSSLSIVRVRGIVVDAPGMLQWFATGKYLVVGDLACATNQSCIYHVAISGDSGTVTGTTKLLDGEGAPVCEFAGGVISGGSKPSIYGGEGACSSQTASVGRWHFPAGGAPVTTYSNPNYISQPIGAAISTRP